MTGCTACGKNIGRIQRMQLNVARRVFRRAEKRFKLDLNADKYEGLCKMCMLTQVDFRLQNLTMEVQIEAEQAGMSAKDYGQDKIKELKKWIEKEAGKGKAPKLPGGFRK